MLMNMGFIFFVGGYRTTGRQRHFSRLNGSCRSWARCDLDGDNTYTPEQARSFGWLGTDVHTSDYDSHVSFMTHLTIFITTEMFDWSRSHFVLNQKIAKNHYSHDGLLKSLETYPMYAT
jgi:hypothetical protein